DNPQAGYQQARLALENAERELARLEALFSKGAVSRQAVDGATLHRDLAKRQLEVAERLLTLKSPIEGVVSELRAEVGKFAPPGIPIAKIVDDRRLRVRFEIPAGDGELIAKGQPCWIKLDNESVEGRIDRIALSADKEGRTFEAWAELSTRPQSSVWRSGVMVEVKVLAINEEEPLLIPPEALVRETGSSVVWKVNRGKAEKVKVTVKGINSDAVWIGQGLSLEDPVIVSGKEHLFPNAPVKIIRLLEDLTSAQ
ncbi:MAG: efflux RND transporter periplasmic adaptor subunit, partial [bacterium]